MEPTSKFNIGYIAGIFDMFNIEHLNFIIQAKDKCEKLIVGVYSDDEVKTLTGQNPVIPFTHRCRIINSLKHVHLVTPVIQENMFTGWSWRKEIISKEYNEKICPKINRVRCTQENNLKQTIYLSNDSHLYSLVDDEFGHHQSSIERTKINNFQIIGYTTGVYDMFHIGHLNLLKRAKERCDYLIVGVSTDECVEGYKNKTPICNYHERAAIVSAIKYVDEVVPQTDMNKVLFLERRHFDIMFHGDEWKGSELYNSYEKQFAKYGARIEYLSHTDGISSTILRQIING